jgi:hypothetical protein
LINSHGSATETTLLRGVGPEEVRRAFATYIMSTGTESDSVERRLFRVVDFSEVAMAHGTTFVHGRFDCWGGTKSGEEGEDLV